MATRKKHFSSFKKTEAFQQLQLNDLLPWEIPPRVLEPSSFLLERLARLRRNFDLEEYEESKKLLIDALCEEAIDQFSSLKIWKGAHLESETASGYVDYLVAEKKRFFTSPLLCIIEAKKDNFEQGLAQCLVEMQACQWQNQQHDQSIDVFGIVTNGNTWQFYRLTTVNLGWESPAHSTGDLPLLLGRLSYVFELCQANLA